MRFFLRAFKLLITSDRTQMSSLKTSWFYFSKLFIGLLQLILRGYLTDDGI